MATIDDKNLEDFPKNTGPVRISRWKKKVVVSGKSSKTPFKTPARQAVTMKFTLLRQLFSPLRAFIAVGFANAEGRATDRALKVNYHKAFVGDYPDIKLDYSAVQLSEGSLPLPSNLEVSTTDSNSVLITWSDTNEGDAGDLLMVLLFNPTANQAIVYTDAARRSDLKASLAYAPWWVDAECMVYAAFHGANSKLASSSSFLGSLQLSFDSTIDFDKSHLFLPRKNKPYKKGEAKNFNTIGISGRVGPVVFYTKDEETIIVRARPSKKSKPQTPAEFQATVRFKMVSKFLYKMHQFVKIGFAAYSDRTLPHSAAMSANLKQIIAGEYPDYRIDYSKAKLSDGPLSPPSIVGHRLASHSLFLTWEATPSPYHGVDGDDDRLLVGVYNPEADESFVSHTEFTRKDGAGSVELPPQWDSSPLFVFLAFTSSVNSSPTTFVII
ncbi:MAG: hypothetical protein IIY87_06520 [Bacteroidales bacterium]|nr:hypothetical protein [Bacteroidales bacterium]